MRATKDCQSYLFQASAVLSTLPPLSDARCSWVCFSFSARCTVKGSVSDDPLSSDDTSDQSPSPSHDDGGHDVLSAAGEQMLPGPSIFHRVFMWKVDSLWRWRGLLTRLANSEIEMSMFLQFLIEGGRCYLCVHLSSSVLEHAFYKTKLKQQGSRLYVTFILNISVKKCIWFLAKC